MQVLFPQTCSELQAMLAAMPQGRMMAGGSDLLVKLRQTGEAPPAVFCLDRLTELHQLGWQGEDYVIGAAVSLQQLLETADFAKNFACLHQAIGELASPPIRHAATLGGNLCSASPAADSVPALIVLEAGVDIEGPGGHRSLPVDGFILGPGMNGLRSGEFVRAVRLPRPPQDLVSSYHKVGRRKAMAIAVASLAAAYRLTADGEVAMIRLAWGSVGPTVIRGGEVEGFICGRPLTEDVLRQAGALARQAVKPIDDIRASADYRRSLAGNLLLRLLPGAIAGEG